MIIETFEPVGPYDRRLAVPVPGAPASPDTASVLQVLNGAGVLTAADLHVARTLARVAGERDHHVILAAALATRAVRSGSVAVDLAEVSASLETTMSGVDRLPDEAGPLDTARPRHGAPTKTALPDPQEWAAAITVSALVASGALVLDQGMVYLQRYHHQEVQVVTDLHARASVAAPTVHESTLEAGLARIFPGEGYAEQRAAAESIVRARTSVLTGGPGTGKTTTVAGVLALLAEQSAAAGERPLRVGLAAPTGKAAARMKSAVAHALSEILGRTLDAATRSVIEPIADVEPTTLHRLLGWRPDSRTRFRHHRTNRLPHDVVLIDEASMLSLTHMARLLEALRPGARLILVGDADQLVSVDAGAVLADLVAGAEASAEPPLALTRLQTVHRFGDTIGALAKALRRGDADAVVAALSAGSEEVEWVRDEDPTTALRAVLTRYSRRVLDAALVGDSAAALDALADHRLLCGHREGPFGVRTWNRNIETWIGEETAMTFYDPMYVGRPLLVTTNDYVNGVLNGDTGVVVASQLPDGTPVRMAVIEGANGPQRFAPSRLGEIDTMHAMTIHKAQGSQAREITVLLPDAESPLLTRELFYTAVTRAEQRVRVVASEKVVRTAVARRVVRASGLRQRLANG